MKLFAILLGGNTKNSNTEIHDMVFVAAESIQSTYNSLLENWFGIPDGLHIDSYSEISHANGYKINLVDENFEIPLNSKKLYFVNLGAYDENIFGEIHTYSVIVAENENEAKKSAKQKFPKGTGKIHTDAIFEIKDRLIFPESKKMKISLEFTGEEKDFEFNNEYNPIPKEFIKEFKKKFK